MQGKKEKLLSLEKNRYKKTRSLMVWNLVLLTILIFWNSIISCQIIARQRGLDESQSGFDMPFRRDLFFCLLDVCRQNWYERVQKDRLKKLDYSRQQSKISSVLHKKSSKNWVYRSVGSKFDWVFLKIFHHLKVCWRIIFMLYCSLQYCLFFSSKKQKNKTKLENAWKRPKSKHWESSIGIWQTERLTALF